jgi:RHS repeat-associated protein
MKIVFGMNTSQMNHLFFILRQKIENSINMNINYLYTAQGQKLRKATHHNYKSTHTTDYCGSFIYEDDVLQTILTPEGRVVVDGSSYAYQYFLKDHLGNTRITFNESGTVIQEDSYYPYGMNMSGLSHSSSEDLPNKFLYNGKELQDDFGLGWYDYGARFYDPTGVHWTTIDPLAEKYYSWTPYNYVANNPILLNDPTGMEWNGPTTQGFNWEGRPDEYEINKTGHVVNQIENKTKDSFHVVDEDGERIEGKSITFEYGTLTGQRNPTNVKVKGEPVKLTTFEIKGDENATKLFEFMSDTKNTGVEWTHAKIGTSTSDKNIVGSTHNKSSTAVGHYLRATGYNLKEVNHNHPSGNNTASPGDRNGAKLYHSKNPSTRLKIYSNKTKSYRGYDENGSTPIPIPMRKITKIF